MSLAIHVLAGFYSGYCSHVHIHIRRIPIQDIPKVQSI